MPLTGGTGLGRYAVLAPINAGGIGEVGRWARTVLMAGAVVFLALSLDHLNVFPAVGEDEPWIAAAPYKLATQGIYGSDLFAGYYGLDRHNYQHMPVYPLLQAGLFKVLGVGVVQMRLLSVLFGLALLFVVFTVGSRLADPRVAAAAVVLLLALRISAGGDATGILLLDRSRINRYDIAVPVFALLAFWTLLRADDDDVNRRRWYFFTGIFTGLASLSHLFGAFWLPVFLALSLANQSSAIDRMRSAALVAGGFVLTWLPWAAYIATGWTDYVGQMRFLAPRFEVFNPSFYLTNILHGTGPISLDWLVQTIRTLPLERPGAWTVIAGVPLAAYVLAFRQQEGIQPRRARMLVLVSAAQLVMFVALLKVKTINYMIGLWPLGALMLAWLGVWLWDRQKTLLRITVVVTLGLILSEGAMRIAHARAAARRASPYDWYTGQIARCIPAGSLVLGLQHYWLGLRQYPYRTWLMPTILANRLYEENPIPLDAGLERINPDIILIDRYMATFFEAAASADHPFHDMQSGYEAFMQRRRAEPLCAIRDRTYGTMSVYRVGLRAQN